MHSAKCTARISLLIIAALFVCGVMGCRTAPIYNVNNQAIYTSKDSQMALDDVARGIIKAGDILGWDMQLVRPGLIVATLNIRTHQAVVEIPFGEREFSIIYKSSINLREKNGKIHKNYNVWVRELSDRIKTEVANNYAMKKVS
jgi:hypothetical protein